MKHKTRINLFTILHILNTFFLFIYIFSVIHLKDFFIIPSSIDLTTVVSPNFSLLYTPS